MAPSPFRFVFSCFSLRLPPFAGASALLNTVCVAACSSYFWGAPRVSWPDESQRAFGSARREEIVSPPHYEWGRTLALIRKPLEKAPIRCLGWTAKAPMHSCVWEGVIGHTM